MKPYLSSQQEVLEAVGSKPEGLTSQEAAVDTCICPRLPNTPRQFWLSLLWSHFSFPLGPIVHKVLFVPSKNLFPQSRGGSVIKSTGLQSQSS